MAIGVCIILFLIFICLFGKDRLGKAAYRKSYDDAKAAMDSEFKRFEPYIASKEDTNEARKIACWDENLYRKKLPPAKETTCARTLRERIWEEAHIQPTPEMITCAILSQTGQVPYEMSWNNYVTSAVEPRRTHWKVEQTFLKWWDKELQDHGMEFRLKFVPRNKATALQFSHEAGAAESIQSENITVYMGSYIWCVKQATSGTQQFIPHAYDYEEPFYDYTLQNQ